MILPWLFGVAMAGDVLPWAAPWDVQVQYRAWQTSRGLEPEPLLCEPLWPDEVQLCFRRVEGEKLVRLHERDGQSTSLREAARSRAREWVSGELETVQVAGMETSYRMLRDARGRAVLGALDPGAITPDLGVPLLVALPSSGVLIAWSGGDPDLDKVMAVGVREIYDGSTDRVSPVVFGWDGKRWFPFAEAKPESSSTPRERPGRQSEKQKRPPADAGGL